MKPLFAIDITNDKKNEAVNGEEFITKTASENIADSLEENQDELQATIKKSQPLWLTITKFVFLMYALIVASGILRADIDFKQAFQNAPILIISGFLSFVAWLILFAFSKIKEKKVLKESNVEKQIEDICKDIKIIFEELGVPSDAKDVDVLMFRYKVKDDEIKPYLGMGNAPFINFEFKAYTDGKRLHLADTNNVYSLDLDELRQITKVNKRIVVIGWNKEESPKKGEYKEYKISVNDGAANTVSYKPYYILEGVHNGEAYGIYFPCYELTTFERLTGLRAKADIEE